MTLFLSLRRPLSLSPPLHHNNLSHSISPPRLAKYLQSIQTTPLTDFHPNTLSLFVRIDARKFELTSNHNSLTAHSKGCFDFLKKKKTITRWIRTLKFYKLNQFRVFLQLIIKKKNFLVTVWYESNPLSILLQSLVFCLSFCSLS